MTKRTYVAVVLDQSGSMDMMRQEAIDAFNDQIAPIKSMQTEDSEVFVSLIVFSNEPTILFANKSADALFQLDKTTYIPHGWTAMYDAVGLAIETITQKDTQPDDAYLCTIISDGEENSSKKYSSERLASIVKELQEGGHWTFTYLGANQDLAVVSQKTGILIGNMAMFCATPQGMNDASKLHTHSTQSYSTSRASGQTQVKDFYKNKN